FAVGETFIVTHFHDFPDAITVRVSPGEVARITNIEGAAPFAGVYYMYDPSVLRFLAEYEFDEGIRWADFTAGAAFAQLLVDYLSSLPRRETGEITEEFVCLTAAETRIAAGAALQLTYDWEVRDGNGTLLSFGDEVTGKAYAAGTTPVTCVLQIDPGDPSRTDDPPLYPDDATEEISYNIDGTDCNTKFHVHWDEIGATGTGETTCTRDVPGIGMAMAFRCGDGQAIEFFEGFKPDIARLLLEGAVENPPDCRIEAQVGVPGQDLTVLEGNVDRTIRDGPVERMVIERIGG
ncbi:MAG: hypothetical protein R3246_14710, partial [Acidimicrobiia bacterium]|nr:hypothetical protein [Acidimicrobiia bacterium]